MIALWLPRLFLLKFFPANLRCSVGLQLTILVGPVMEWQSFWIAWVGVRFVTDRLHSYRRGTERKRLDIARLICFIRQSLNKIVTISPFYTPWQVCSFDLSPEFSNSLPLDVISSGHWQCPFKRELYCGHPSPLVENLSAIDRLILLQKLMRGTIDRRIAILLTVSSLSVNGLAKTLGPPTPLPILSGRLLEIYDADAVMRFFRPTQDELPQTTVPYLM